MQQIISIYICDLLIPEEMLIICKSYQSCMNRKQCLQNSISSLKSSKGCCLSCDLCSTTALKLFAKQFGNNCMQYE